MCTEESKPFAFAIRVIIERLLTNSVKTDYLFESNS